MSSFVSSIVEQHYVVFKKTKLIVIIIMEQLSSEIGLNMAKKGTGMRAIVVTSCTWNVLQTFDLDIQLKRHFDHRSRPSKWELQLGFTSTRGY